jgi:hypothetical protein
VFRRKQTQTCCPLSLSMSQSLLGHAAIPVPSPPFHNLSLTILCYCASTWDFSFSSYLAPRLIDERFIFSNAALIFFINSAQSCRIQVSGAFLLTLLQVCLLFARLYRIYFAYLPSNSSTIFGQPKQACHWY